MIKKPNGLTVAHIAAYGRLPDKPLAGMTGAPKRKWNGYTVDAHLKDEWLERLNAIKEIKILSLEEGENPERVPHIIFNLTSKRYCIDDIAWKIQMIGGGYVFIDTGNNGKQRITIAGRVLYGQPKWAKWWNKTISGLEKIFRENS